MNSMKRKILIISAGAILLGILLMILMSSGRQILTDSVSTTMVVNRHFTRMYETTGTVDSSLHHYYFSGCIISCGLSEGMYVPAGGVLLKYRNVKDKAVTLKSTVDGYVREVSDNRVTISDRDYYIVSRLPQDLSSVIRKGDEAVLEINGTRRALTVSRIGDCGKMIDGEVMFDVIFTPEDNENLKINQQGNVTILLDNYGSVPVVDRKAILSDEKGSFLLAEDWKDDPGGIDDYRIDIKIIAVNQEVAYISGMDIEGVTVCILSEQLKELIHDQAD